LTKREFGGGCSRRVVKLNLPRISRQCVFGNRAETTAVISNAAVFKIVIASSPNFECFSPPYFHSIPLLVASSERSASGQMLPYLRVAEHVKKKGLCKATALIAEATNWRLMTWTEMSFSISSIEGVL
jgi:hypothetical protein